MPEKSVRELNKWERLHYSLAARMFHSIIRVSIIFGLASLLIGLGLYAYALSGQYIGEGFYLSRTASHLASRSLEIEPYLEETRQIYESLSPQELAAVGSEEYYRHFAHMTEDGTYKRLMEMLQEFQESSDVNAFYVGFYDEANARLVMLADPDTEEPLRIGEYEAVDPKEAQKFNHWNGEGRLYHISNVGDNGWIATAGFPIKDGISGKTLGFFLADVTLKEIWNGIKTFLLQFTVVMTVIVNLVAYFFTRHMKKKVVKPINEIAEAATAYVKDKREGNPVTDHFSRNVLKIDTGDEIENLALTMEDMEQDLIEFERNLTQVTAEKERIGTELALATRIQADMLPNIYPAFPERTEFDIYATMDPAKEVGGDFYDFFLIDQNHLGLVMADVSGKGIPAALFMMVSKILVQNVALTGKSPAEVLETVNNQICSNNREEMFVTVWFGILDLQSGLLTAANAGHEFPVLKKPDGAYELVKDKHGFVIGGMPGMKYKEYEILMEPDTKLFLYTDGLPEATNAREELFGTERMLAALRQLEEAEPCQVLAGVNAAVEHFVDQAPQFDDLTMLCLHYLGPQAAPREENKKEEPAMKELTLEATIPNIETVTDFVNAELEAADCPLKVQMQIDVAIDEVFSNIAQYAYGEAGGSATVGIAISEEPRMMTLIFKDQGMPYNPLENKDPNINLPAEAREIGGLGIFMVKKTMDEVLYDFKDGQNILTLKKTI